MQTIDPIKPMSRSAPNTAPPPHPRAHAMSDIVRPHPVVRQKQPQSPYPAQTGARFTKLPAQKQKRHIPWNVIVPVLLSPTMVFAAMFGAVGLAVAALYVVVALVVRLSSRVSFAFALMGLIYTAGLQFSGNVALAQTVAGQVYILFIGGAVALGLEVRRDNKLWFKKHH